MKSHSQNEGAKTSSSSIANATANGNANVSRKGDGEGYDLTSIHSKANGGGGGGKSYPTPSSTTSSSSVVHTERPQISILPAPPGYNQRYHKNNLQRTTSNEHASTKLVNGGIRGNDVKERSSSSFVVRKSSTGTTPASSKNKKSSSTSASLVSSSSRGGGGKGSSSGSKKKSKQPLDRSKLRKGKWTVEEEEYTTRIIHHFGTGTLTLPEGTTLRSYLAEKLCCDRMRITKKFAGANYLGKRIAGYHMPHSEQKQHMTSIDVDAAKAELLQLEHRFKLRVEQGRSAISSSTSAHTVQQGRHLGRNHCNRAVPNGAVHSGTHSSGIMPPSSLSIPRNGLAEDQGGVPQTRQHHVSAAGCVNNIAGPLGNSQLPSLLQARHNHRSVPLRQQQQNINYRPADASGLNDAPAWNMPNPSTSCQPGDSAEQSTPSNPTALHIMQQITSLNLTRQNLAMQQQQSNQHTNISSTSDIGAQNVTVLNNIVATALAHAQQAVNSLPPSVLNKLVVSQLAQQALQAAFSNQRRPQDVLSNIEEIISNFPSTKHHANIQQQQHSAVGNMASVSQFQAHELSSLLSWQMQLQAANAVDTNHGASAAMGSVLPHQVNNLSNNSNHHSGNKVPNKVPLQQKNDGAPLGGSAHTLSSSHLLQVPEMANIKINTGSSLDDLQYRQLQESSVQNSVQAFLQQKQQQQLYNQSQLHFQSFPALENYNSSLNTLNEVHNAALMKKESTIPSNVPSQVINQNNSQPQLSLAPNNLTHSVSTKKNDSYKAISQPLNTLEPKDRKERSKEETDTATMLLSILNTLRSNHHEALKSLAASEGQSLVVEQGNNNSTFVANRGETPKSEEGKSPVQTSIKRNKSPENESSLSCSNSARSSSPRSSENGLKNDEVDNVVVQKTKAHNSDSSADESNSGRVATVSDAGKTDSSGTKSSSSGNGSDSGGSSDHRQLNVDVGSEAMKTDQSSGCSGSASSEDDDADSKSRNANFLPLKKRRKTSPLNVIEFTSRNVADHNSRMDAMQSDSLLVHNVSRVMGPDSQN